LHEKKDSGIKSSVPLKYDPKNGFTVTKLECARRQLDTAIELWFGDGDPISIRTLTVRKKDRHL
jgi:hypothetical protein